MSNYEKISVKSFERNSKRFGILAKEYLNNIYSDDIALMDHIGNIFNYYVDDSLNKFLRTYKMSPNKKKSAHIYKLKEFSNNNGVLINFKLSYEFIDDIIVFKLLIKYNGLKYKRKVKFVLKIKNFST